MLVNLHPVDAYGVAKAELTELEARVEAARLQVIALGEGAHEGELFRATVTTADRKVYDNAAIRAKCSHQLVAAHTSVEARTTVRVAGRNGREVAA